MINHRAVEQIVGPERRERVSHQTWCSEGGVNRAARSTQTFARIALSKTTNGTRGLLPLHTARLFRSSVDWLPVGAALSRSM